MSKTLGIDVGTNSLGWAWVDKATNQVYLGSHIFQEGVDRDKSGSEQSRNESRQLKRTLRRSYMRYKLRRARLRYVLRQFDMLPDPVWAASLRASDLYRLRYKGITEALTQAELGLVLLHMNQHRGYNATREDLAKQSDVNDEIAADDTKPKKKKEKEGEGEGSKEASYKDMVRGFDEKFIASGQPTVGAYFYVLFEQQIQLGRNGSKIDSPSHRIRNWAGGINIVLRQRYIEEFDKIMAEQRKHHPVLTQQVRSLSRYKREQRIEPTLHEQIRDEVIYYQRRLKSARHMVLPCKYEFESYVYKIRNDQGSTEKVESRKRGLPCAATSHPDYQQFRIWKQVHNLRIKAATGTGVAKYLVPDDDSGRLNQVGLKRLAEHLQNHEQLGIKDILKKLDLTKGKLDQHDDGSGESSSKTVVGNRTRVRLRTALGTEVYDALTDDQRIKLWEWAATASNPDYLRRIAAKAAEKWQLPALTPRLDHLAQVVLEDGYGRLSAKACRKLLPYMQGVGEPTALRIHEDDVAEFARAKQHLKPYLPPHTELSAGVVENWEGSYLPEDAAVRVLYGHHSDSRKHTAVDRELKDKIDPVDVKSLRNPVVARSLSQAIKVINAILKDPRMGRPDIVRVEMGRELGKPKKKREEMYKNNLENYRQRQQDIADLARYDLADEKITNRALAIYRSAQEGGEEFNPEMLESGNLGQSGWARGKSRLLRYRLWKEAGECCVYSGQTIPFSDLYDKGKVDLDHIIPRSLGGANAPSNLAICYTSQNQRKGNSIPFEVWGSNASIWKDFRKRILSSKLPPGKKELILAEELPKGFALGQLSDTRWVASELLWRLRTVVPIVKASKGAITSELRGAWMKGSDGLRLPPQPSAQPKILKDRTNHLHHALDAAVIAAVPHDLEQRLIAAAKNNQAGNWRKSEFETDLDSAKHLPWPTFKQDVNQALAEALVSHQKQTRLLVKKRNSYKYWRTHERHEDAQLLKPVQKSYSVRGQLHAETIYSKRTEKDLKGNEKAYYVIRKPVNSAFTLGQLESVIDKHVRATIEAHIAEHGGEHSDPAKRLKTALHPDVLAAHPIYLPNHKAQQRIAKLGLPPENAVKAEVKAVRIREESSSALEIPPPIIEEDKEKERLRRKHSLFVEPQNNYLLGLYRGQIEKRIGKSEKRLVTCCTGGRMLTYLEAVQRKRAGQPLDDGVPFSFTLQQDDLVLMYQDNEDPAEVTQLPQTELTKRLYRLRSMSATPNIYLVFEHHSVANGAELTRTKGDIHIAPEFSFVKHRSIVRITSPANIRVIPVRLNTLGRIITKRIPT
jgi:CRISPR-associated endonuclease Csn1